MRAFNSKIHTSDPEVTILISHERENEVDQQKYGSMTVGAFTIEEAEALIDLLTNEANRARKVRNALATGHGLEVTR